MPVNRKGKGEPFLSITMDDTIDVSNGTQLIHNIRYVHNNYIHDDP